MQQHDETNKRSDATGRFSAKNLRGILLPFHTPFDEDDRVDLRALRSNIERWNATGIDGYVALGSTGERVHLDEGECAEVIETARECVPAQMAFIVGTGQQSTRATIAEVRAAARAGADAVLVITPGFYRAALTQAALTNHFTAVADDSPVPVVLYSIPQNTNVSLAPETIARLGEHENVAGIKDSSGDMLNLAETLRLAPDDFSVLTGHAAVLHASLLAGARGGVLAVGCVAARLSVAIYRAVEAGAHEQARRMQRRLAPLARAVTTQYGVGGLKAALDICGYVGGRVRAPLETPSEAARLEIARLLEASALKAEEEKFLETAARGART